MTHKEIAKSFLKLAGTGQIRDAFYRYIADDFIHHNQYFKGDRESLKVAMEQAHEQSPNKSIEVKQVFEDGDTVITHSRVVKKDSEIAVVHIFRFEGDKVAELWDLGQVAIEDSPNDNGLF
jgi:predicted SnoaL-like aldol condensation-catalyzing enzyme